MSIIDKNTFAYLNKLDANNNRDWFNNHKDDYTGQHENMIGFADDLLALMNQHDQLETVSGKKSLHRIYRDVRFSKDKAPYKTHWGGSFKRATKLLRGGYYYHIQPGGKSFIGGGFWSPNKEDLQRVREDLSINASELRSIITSPDFVDTFEQLQGDQLKTAPKGFDKEHTDIDLLRYKQFLIGRNFTDAEVMSKDFVHKANETFQKMRPFFNYMSDALTTDSNGTPIY
ncbi:MAG: hypothetical protein ACI865_002410 [Flavobacteriaceae bacterium]|jgi:uncharacterized protein (TIGR02453 family)